MTRLLFVMTFVAIWMLPQLSEAQLFRRGFRARGFQQATPQPRARIFQTPRNLQTPNIQGQLRQLANLQVNPQVINSSIEALRSVLDSSLNNRNGTQGPSAVPSQQPSNLGRINRQPAASNRQTAPAAQTETPTAAKKVYSILVTPDKPKSQEGEKANSESDETPKIDASKTRLDITTPPLEPIEVKPENSILQIVESPRNGGK